MHLVFRSCHGVLRTAESSRESHGCVNRICNERLPMTTRFHVRTAIYWLCVLLVGLVSAAPSFAQPPKDSERCTVTWEAICGASGSGTSAVHPTCEEAQAEAYDLACQHANAHCDPEQSYEIRLGECQCLPESSEPASPQKPAPASSKWVVQYSCMGCTGNKLTITASGTTFCEAYLAARKAVHKLISRPQHGGARPGSCCYCVVSRPACNCCCRR